jgi:nitric oxide synthase oxygenase domain/subunit
MTYEQLTVRMAMASWTNTVGRVDKAFWELTEEQFLREIATGRNRIIYLVGHLTAINDANFSPSRSTFRIRFQPKQRRFYFSPPLHRGLAFNLARMG